jgi:hypothetical protein
MEESMGRLRLGAIGALTWFVLASPAGAAEISNVASSGEPTKSFELRLSLRWDRMQERAQITRERPVGWDPLHPTGAPSPDAPFGAIEDGDELRYSRSKNVMIPRVAFGVYPDVELSFELPYVLGDDRSWRFGFVSGAPSGGGPVISSIEANTIDANGQQTCVAACPLFPVAPRTTVYHGGRAGDFKAGIAWAVFNDKKDDTKPYWRVGLDVTFPTASLYDPAVDRGTNWSSPHSVAAKPGPFGEKVWKYDLNTVLSRRMGPIDPYFKAHVTAMMKSNDTYSNCNHAAELAARLPAEMNGAAVENCGDSAAQAKLPWITGMTFGTEIVPYESAADQQRISIDLRVFADYTSSQRFYNELTDASGKIHLTEGFLTMGGYLGFYLRASEYVSLHAAASLATETSHLLTGEALGKTANSWPAFSVNGITNDRSQMNPNFDWRYDAPGRRFRISEVSLFAMSLAGVLTF